MTGSRNCFQPVPALVPGFRFDGGSGTSLFLAVELFPDRTEHASMQKDSNRLSGQLVPELVPDRENLSPAASHSIRTKAKNKVVPVVPPTGAKAPPTGAFGLCPHSLGLPAVGPSVELTHEAQIVLRTIQRRAPMTRGQVVLWGPPEWRMRIRCALDELLKAGYVYRDRLGWYRPASQVKK